MSDSTAATSSDFPTPAGDFAGVPLIKPAAAPRRKLRPYPHESALFVIMALMSGWVWLLLTIMTVGLVWVFMLVLYLIGLFGFSYFITYIRGNGVRVTPDQFPDLHQRFSECVTTLGLKQAPEFYLITGNGALNAFATRFLHRYYVVLLTDIVDALEDDPEALNFYIGHELGHIAQKHLIHHWWLVFARGMPLLGAAYSRAREYTCDQYGLLCCQDQQSAVHALAVLAAGSRRWKGMNTQAFIKQSEQSGGFWMSLNELTGDYPWLCKRVARVQDAKVQFPRRSKWAWVFAATVPNTGFGLIGAMIIYVYILFFVLMMGVAAYGSFNKKTESAAAQTHLSQAYDAVFAATQRVDAHFAEAGNVDGFDLSAAGFKNPDSEWVERVEYVADDASLVGHLNAPYAENKIILTPELSTDGGHTLLWHCQISGQIAAEAIPEHCTALDAEAEAPAAKPLDGVLEKLLKEQKS